MEARTRERLSPAPPTTGDPRVTVVSVNYRTAELAVRCLATLADERSELPLLEAVVVDNASGDGSVERLHAAIEENGWGSWARVIASPRNGGFAAGNNLALREARSAATPPDYFCLLNPDTEVEPGALATLVAFLRDHPAAGIVGPATEIGRGSLRGTAFRFPGVLNGFDEGLHFGPVSRLLSRWSLAPEPRAEAHETDWLSGGCLVFPRAVLDEVGLMDEGYFLYFEEVDFLHRALERGFPCWYVPQARIIHFAGASTGLTGGRELERRVPAYWFESRRRYLVRHRGRLVALAADLAWILGNALWNLRRAVTREPRREPPHFFWDFVRFNLLGLRPPATAEES